jgi:uncharacterized membrane protein
VSFDDWMLALHVLSAFSLVAGVTLFWVLIVAVRQADTPEATLRLGPLTRVADSAVGIGAGGTIVLGVWLAFSVGGYDIWDGWIVAALVLWFLVAALGRRASAVYAAGVTKALELQRAGRTGADAELAALNRTPRGVLLQALITAAVLLVILDMIWKPGA